MGKAAQLLKNKQEIEQSKSKSGVVRVDDSAIVDVPFYSRKSTVRAVARLFRIANAKLKTMETEVESLKNVLRAVGQQELDTNSEAGKYVSKVDVAGISVCRANKFKPVPYDRDALMEAVGPVEYRVFFNEKASIKFDNIDEERSFVQICKDAGVDVSGTVEEIVVGNAAFGEYIARTSKSLDAERLALLKDCASDQAARVGGR